MPFIILSFIALFACGYWATKILIQFAQKQQLLDVANHRSSHTQATPRIGGLGFVPIISVLMVAFIFVVGLETPTPFTPLFQLVLPALIVASIGLIDDLRGLSQAVRFSLYLASSLIAASSLINMGDNTELASFLLWICAGIAVTWWINLFNFMDGIDGIASTEGVFLLGAMAYFFYIGSHPLFALLIILSIAPLLGFLVLNWQPAKIFMGDIGSTFLGCLIAGLSCVGIQKGCFSIYTVLILGASFWVDTTWTLGRRLLTGQQWYRAHRSHSYQILARKLGAHEKATLRYVAINILWLLPLALLSQHLLGYALLITLISWLPLAILCFIIGAGKASHN